MKEKCPNCDKKYKSLGKHWRWNSSHRPEFTENHHEIITGMLMGDGWLDRRYENTCLRIEMTSPNYLSYISSIFGCLGNDVVLKESSSDIAEKLSGCEENYSDNFYWSIRSHPELNKYNSWYSSGNKIWPKDIELTPTVLKHWYVGDGSFKNSEGKCIYIAMSNESSNTEKVSDMFRNSKIPIPSNYSKWKKDGKEQCVAQFTHSASEELWEYMGNPLPDFEYKWPEEYS